MAKKPFSAIVKDVKATTISFPFFNAFVSAQFILFLDDHLVRFAGKRRANGYHDSKRPVAVMTKDADRALFIPATTKTNNNRYTIRVAGGAINGLHKNGWFLTRYYQNEPASFFEQKGKCAPGSKIPDKIFTEMQEKLNAFIDGQAG